MGRVSNAREQLLQAAKDLMWESSYGSLTIDQICAKAGVKKGSFYYFFDSKSELAAEAVFDMWESKLPEMDATFSPCKPPLERLRAYCAQARDLQCRLHKTGGRVLGCPFFSVGAEICAIEQPLAQRIQRILDMLRRYFESAIRDAQAEGSVKVADPARAARCVIAFSEGLLTQARIQNEPRVLDELWPGVKTILGVEEEKLSLTTEHA